ncbi:hypothetical protein NEMIN01_0437 [Nematocida minor]|uniref:uncharacterized protein n=1 Tax=Nematocida minor TaxID=1912983 RepID=UPI00221FE5E6|nr:uncharacterized protein NEMIN01_0437 [Nematocida minor]KAI5189374.1 hypothetical protein NEMIN01_0437 [Nematocida minor]
MNSQPKEYISAIQTKYKFTDVPAAFIGLVNIAIFLSITFSYSYKDLIGLAPSIGQVEQKNFIFGAFAILASYFTPIVSLLLFRVITKPMIYFNFALLFSLLGYGMYVSLTAGYLLSFISQLLIFVLSVTIFYKVIEDIEAVKYFIKMSCEIILSNIMCYSLCYVSCAVLICVLHAATFGFIFLNDVLAHRNSSYYDVTVLVKCIYTVFNLSFIVFSFLWAVSTLYAKMTHQYMLNKVNKKEYHRSAMGVGLKRMVLSTGTIFIAALLSAVIFVLRQLSENAFNREQRSRDRSILVLIVLFIASIILMLLDVVIEQLNNYCIVYNSLYGTNYVTSMKRAADHIINTNFGFYRKICSISMFTFILAFNLLVGAGVMKVADIYMRDLTTLKTSADYGVMSLIFLVLFMVGSLISPIFMSTITAIEFISYGDPQLVKKAFPICTRNIAALSY